MSSNNGDGGISTTSPGPGTVPAASIDLTARRVEHESFDFNGWKISLTKSPILPSNCYCTTEQKKGQAGNNGEGTSSACQVCRFANELTLTHLPEMVFPDNILKLVYEETGFVLEFNTFDALKLINARTSSSITVACSENWKASKIESGLPTNEALKPFDWTYSTDYKGNMKYIGKDTEPEIVSNPPEKLDLEKLKQREAILFYQELQLYEDELHDNGVSNLSVKIRVMPSGFFILQRFFLRVDHVLIKMCDTRIHFEVGNSYFLRQFQVREQNYAALSHLEPQLLTNPNALYSHLPFLSEFNEKIYFKESS